MRPRSPPRDRSSPRRRTLRSTARCSRSRRFPRCRSALGRKSCHRALACPCRCSSGLRRCRRRFRGRTGLPECKSHPPCIRSRTFQRCRSAIGRKRCRRALACPCRCSSGLRRCRRRFRGRTGLPECKSHPPCMRSRTFPRCRSALRHTKYRSRQACPCRCSSGLRRCRRRFRGRTDLPECKSHPPCTRSRTFPRRRPSLRRRTFRREPVSPYRGRSSFRGCHRTALPDRRGSQAYKGRPKRTCIRTSANIRGAAVPRGRCRASPDTRRRIRGKGQGYSRSSVGSMRRRSSCRGRRTRPSGTRRRMCTRRRCSGSRTLRRRRPSPVRRRCRWRPCIRPRSLPRDRPSPGRRPCRLGEECSQSGRRVWPPSSESALENRNRTSGKGRQERGGSVSGARNSPFVLRAKLRARCSGGMTPAGRTVARRRTRARICQAIRRLAFLTAALSGSGSA
jgi:hypothetical protein